MNFVLKKNENDLFQEILHEYLKPDINFCNFEELLRLLKFKFIFPGLRNCLNFTNKTEIIINLDQQIKNFDRKSETYPLFSHFFNRIARDGNQTHS